MRLPRFWTPRSRDAVIGAPYLWLGLFFLLPFMLVLRISLAQMDGAQVSPLVTLTGGELTFRFHLTPYLQLLSDDLYLHAYLVSLKYALVTTVLCLLIVAALALFGKSQISQVKAPQATIAETKASIGAITDAIEFGAQDAKNRTTPSDAVAVTTAAKLVKPASDDWA